MSTIDGFLKAKLFALHKPTLVRVMLNWMVRMTTRMSKLPSEISVNDLSVYHEMFFSTCERQRERQSNEKCLLKTSGMFILASANNESMQRQYMKCKQTCIKTMSTHHLVDGAIEGIILCKDEQNNEGHVDMMRISVLHVVKDLEDGQHLRGGQAGQEKRG